MKKLLLLSIAALSASSYATVTFNLHLYNQTNNDIELYAYAPSTEIWYYSPTFDGNYTQISDGKYYHIPAGSSIYAHFQTTSDGFHDPRLNLMNPQYDIQLMDYALGTAVVRGVQNATVENDGSGWKYNFNVYLKTNHDVPKGSYRDSCKFITYDGTTVHADCLDHNNGWINTSVPFPNSNCSANHGLANHDGSLWCE